jgi:glycosyltransferase involved in cell wall biosynthesis
MKILRVISSCKAKGGGPIEGSKRLNEVMMREDHSIEYVTLDDPKDEEVRSFPYPVHAQGPGKTYFNYSPKLKDWLIKNGSNYDAVLVHGLWQYHCSAVYGARQNLPNGYFVQTHGMLDPWFNQFKLKYLKKLPFWYGHLKPFLAQANAVLFTTEEERIVSRESFPGYQANEVVVPYGTSRVEGDPEQQKAAFFDEFPDLKDRKILLYLSRIHPKKGVNLLLTALKKNAEDEGFTLVMAGPDNTPYANDMKALAKQLGVAERVRWTGMLTDDVKYGAFHAADAFVLPSHQENFGIAVAEAMACARPVFITDKVNIWREVDAANAGVVRPDTQEGIDSLLEAYFKSTPEELSKMGENALTCFEHNFEITKSAEAMLQLLDPGNRPKR